MKLKIKGVLLERGYQVLQDNISGGKPTYNLYRSRDLRWSHNLGQRCLEYVKAKLSPHGAGVK